jgi:hypothetical protein
MFKEGRKNIHGEDRSVWPSVVNDDLVQSERRRMKMSELSNEFPQISLTVLYEIITVRIVCHKFYAKCVPKILTSEHKNQRMASDFTYTFRAIPQRWRLISHSHSTSNR